MAGPEGLRLEHVQGQAQPDQAIGPDSLFWVGSISKQFAAAAIMRLVEQGRASLGTPVASYVPGWRADALSLDGVSCTLEHLLSHTCGLPPDLPGRGDYYDTLEREDRRHALLLRLERETPSHTPGTHHVYSNVGYTLAGVLVELISGQDYEAFLQRELFARAGMGSTAVRPSTLPAFEARVAHGEFPLPFLWLSAPRWLALDPRTPATFGAAGNIVSTAADQERWLRALFSGRVLSPTSLAEMTRPRLDGYGLGLVVSQEPFGRVVWHNGAISPHGYNSFAGIVAESGVTAVLLSNRTPELVNGTRLGLSLLAAAHGKAGRRPLFDVGPMSKLLSGWPGLVCFVLPLAAVLGMVSAAFRRVRVDRATHATTLLQQATIIVIVTTGVRDASDALFIALFAALLSVASFGAALPRMPKGPTIDRGRRLKTWLSVITAAAVLTLAVYFVPSAAGWVLVGLMPTLLLLARFAEAILRHAQAARPLGLRTPP